jgi:hypothetical protein
MATQRDRLSIKHRHLMPVTRQIPSACDAYHSFPPYFLCCKSVFSS